jgi:hypothetical protein
VFLSNLKATGPPVQVAARDIFLKVKLTTQPILGKVQKAWDYISTPKKILHEMMLNYEQPELL